MAGVTGMVAVVSITVAVDIYGVGIGSGRQTSGTFPVNIKTIGPSPLLPTRSVDILRLRPRCLTAVLQHFPCSRAGLP